MDWNRLICDKRLGLEDYHDPRDRATRSDFQRDYDRLVFSSPFRRLQNKTQVFPLPGSIFVHNRLTHSLEVSCVGRSIAKEIVRRLRKKYIGEPWIDCLDFAGEIVGAACLAHDLGNPPFGHSGETAISTFFSEGKGKHLQERLSAKEWADLTSFEGNANAFRLLTHQFRGRRKGGFAMTYSTLASIVKYPHESSVAKDRYGKFGFFSSEVDDFVKIAEELGLKRISKPGEPIVYTRHPLVYIVEAADDICYEVMDFEDAHKLKILSTDTVIEYFSAFFPQDRLRRMCEVMVDVYDPNEKIAYLRSCVIGRLVECCVESFVTHESEILAGTFESTLVRSIPDLEKQAYDQCKKLSYEKIYNAPEVVDVELAGHRIITSLMEHLINAVISPELSYSRLLLSKFPGQYDTQAPTLFGRIQSVLDHISGMTDVYALDLYRKLQGQSLPAV